MVRALREGKIRGRERVNLVSRIRLCCLRDCFKDHISARDAAVACGVNRNTAMRYYQEFRSGGSRLADLPRTDDEYRGLAFVHARVAVPTFQKLQKEAAARKITTYDLVARILDLTARDDIFAAILDD